MDRNNGRINTGNAADFDITKNGKGETIMHNKYHDWNRENAGEGGKKFPGRDLVDNWDVKAVQPSRKRVSGIDDYIHTQGYETGPSDEYSTKTYRTQRMANNAKYLDEHYLGNVNDARADNERIRRENHRSEARAELPGYKKTKDLTYRRGYEDAVSKSNGYDSTSYLYDGQDGKFATDRNRENLLNALRAELGVKRGEKIDAEKLSGMDERRKTLIKHMLQQDLADYGATGDSLPEWLRDLDTKYNLGYNPKEG